MRAPLAFVTCAALALAALPPSPARACGGTFCARTPPGQPPMPVDQSGENVLFVVDGGRVEAHVQIQYTGDPERFAWVVPMPKIPEVRPGSQRLFTNLLQNTQPVLLTQGAFASCASPSFGDSDSSGCGSSVKELQSADASGSPRFGGSAGSGGNGGNGPVLSRQSVGAYEVVILHSSTAEELLTWLDENDYLIPPNTTDFIQSYLEQRYVFVGVKLTAGAGLDEIHPLVFSYEGTQPCVPLKLTAVAAVENMAVRTFFLGDKRFGPSNYKHVVLNETLLNWSTGPSASYNQAIGRAVDSPLANGRAFVTEFAGPTSADVTVLSAPSPSTPFGPSNPTTRVQLRSALGQGLFDINWNASVFKTADPEKAISALKTQNLLNCGGPSSICTSSHPLLMPLLRKYLVPPKGISEEAYYGCPSCYQTPQTWEPEAFAAEFDERIVQPGKHAEELVRNNPYLTRMFTTISPSEMTEDPEFVATERADIDTLRNPTNQQECDGRATMRFAGGREVILDNSAAQWPSFSEKMPAAERVEEYQQDGRVVVLQDNKAAIDAELKAFNKSKNWPPEPEFTVNENSCALGPVRGRTTTKGLLVLAALGLLARRWRRSQ